MRCCVKVSLCAYVHTTICRYMFVYTHVHIYTLYTFSYFFEGFCVIGRIEVVSPSASLSVCLCVCPSACMHPCVYVCLMYVLCMLLLCISYICLMYVFCTCLCYVLCVSYVCLMRVLCMSYVLCLMYVLCVSLLCLFVCMSYVYVCVVVFMYVCIGRRSSTSLASVGRRPSSSLSQDKGGRAHLQSCSPRFGLVSPTGV